MHAVEVIELFDNACDSDLCVVTKKRDGSKGKHISMHGLSDKEKSTACKLSKEGTRMFLVFTDNDARMLMTEDAMKRRGMEVPGNGD
ncbi:MAG: hypothetical protein ACXABY_00790 [Candidatus Thorarchaeota archaeon]|jgi:hypothetical protein